VIIGFLKFGLRATDLFIIRLLPCCPKPHVKRRLIIPAQESNKKGHLLLTIGVLGLRLGYCSDSNLDLSPHC
jgi:hypothetical protein